MLRPSFALHIKISVRCAISRSISRKYIIRATLIDIEQTNERVSRSAGAGMAEWRLAPSEILNFLLKIRVEYGGYRKLVSGLARSRG